jgi:signal transduction histidine kinase
MLSGIKIVNIGVFASEGIALAFALHYGIKVIPGIFIGQFILAYSNSIALSATFAISVINSLEAVMAIYLFEYFKISRSLSSFRDILGMSAIIVFALQPFSALFSNTVLFLSSQIPKGTFLHSSFSWWFGNVMGQLLFTPFLLSLFKKYKEINFVEYAIYGTVFFAYIYTLEIVLVVTNPFLLIALSAPIVILVVSHKNMAYGSLMSVIVAMVASYSVYKAIGAFYINSEINNIINYNLFVLSHISIVLTAGVLFEQKHLHESKLQNTIQREIKRNQEQQLLMLQQSRLAQMGEMISMIAHQWRQPLNNLSLINQLLVSKYTKNKLDDEAVEYFRVNSKKQIDLMTSTIDDFRTFFKSQKNKSVFSINKAITSTIDMVESIYSSKGIDINFNAQRDYKITGYQNALSQVVLNIINNAKDALVDRDVDDRRIDINIDELDEYIVVSIKDNAGGIPESIIDKIFDPYFSTKQDKNGTGLGLYMSKMIIQEQLGAKIYVNNEADGANFKIYLKREENVDE